MARVHAVVKEERLKERLAEAEHETKFRAIIPAKLIYLIGRATVLGLQSRVDIKEGSSELKSVHFYGTAHGDIAHFEDTLTLESDEWEFEQVEDDFLKIETRIKQEIMDRNRFQEMMEEIDPDSRRILKKFRNVI